MVHIGLGADIKLTGFGANITRSWCRYQTETWCRYQTETSMIEGLGLAGYPVSPEHAAHSSRTPWGKGRVLGFGAWGLKFWVWGLGVEVSGLGVRVQDLWAGAGSSSVKVWGFGFTGSGSGLKVQGRGQVLGVGG